MMALGLGVPMEGAIPTVLVSAWRGNLGDPMSCHIKRTWGPDALPVAQRKWFDTWTCFQKVSRVGVRESWGRKSVLRLRLWDSTARERTRMRTRWAKDTMNLDEDGHARHSRALWHISALQKGVFVWCHCEALSERVARLVWHQVPFEGRTLGQTLKLRPQAEVLRPQNSVQSVLFWPWFLLWKSFAKLGVSSSKKNMFTVSRQKITAELTCSPRFHFVRPRCFLILYLADSADSRHGRLSLRRYALRWSLDPWFAGWIGFGTAEAGVGVILSWPWKNRNNRKSPKNKESDHYFGKVNKPTPKLADRQKQKKSSWIFGAQITRGSPFLRPQMPRRSARPASVQMAGWVYHLSNKIPKKTERTRRVVWLLKGEFERDS